MKRVVIVASDFSPSSYPPALRIRFFARHLPEYGWTPQILTIDPRFYEWPTDPENNRLLPSGLEVTRTPAFDATVTRRLGIGDLGIRSLWHHWRALDRICRQDRRPDLVFIPVPPYVPMILGRLMRARFGIPYVVDFIDPWATNYYWRLPRAKRPPKWMLAYLLARLVEPVALRRVAHLTAVDHAYAEPALERYHWLTPRDVTEIPYGGEPADFEYLKAHPRKHGIFDPGDGLLHLSYVGRGGPDMLATTAALFQAARLGLEQAPSLFGRLRLHFVGTTYAKDASGVSQILQLARELGLENLVDEHPTRVPYLDALQILLDSHALVVLGSETPYYTASKIFPNILAKRPILAIFHQDSSVVRILHETQAGVVLTFADVAQSSELTWEIMQQLQTLLSLSSNHEPPTRWGSFEPYTTRVMAGRLAGVFDRVVGRTADVPARA